MTESDPNDETAEAAAGGAPTARWTEELGMAVTFLTRLPWTGGVAHDRPLMAAAWAFPVVGAGLGALAALLFGISDELRLPPLAAALVAVAGVALATGALHEDGLADLADGFGGGRDPERKRAIMRDSRIGSYGVLALIVAVGLKAAALAAVAEGAEAAAVLVCAHALGRAVAPALAAALPPAAPDGLARMAGRPGRPGVLWALGLGGGVALLTLPTAMAVPALLAAGGAAAAVGLLARRQIGGITGDVLGAAVLVAETAVLLAVVAVGKGAV